MVDTFGYVGSEPVVRVDVRRGEEHRLLRYAATDVVPLNGTGEGESYS